MEPHLEEVFKAGGIPTFTFVQPTEYNKLLISMRTPGKGVVVEGPSGIGKTTAIKNALSELGIDQTAQVLSARKADDIELIRELPSIKDAGTVVIDDFHKLEDADRVLIANYLKTLADEEVEHTKIIIVGINAAGQALIDIAEDLSLRLEIIKFEHNSENKITELITKGEDALNIIINVKEEVTQVSKGSFFIAQMLCQYICLKSNILERGQDVAETAISFESIKTEVWDKLGQRFKNRVMDFCRGTRFRPEGRAPYLHLLVWLAQSEEWSLSIRDAMMRHTELAGSVGQVVDKGYLSKLINNNIDLFNVLHFDKNSRMLSVEDPQFLFFIQNMHWATLTGELGYPGSNFPRRYDFALSFAGQERPIAEMIFNKLRERDIEVFYDKNEQHRILAEDVEEYLRPIYQSEAEFVICLLSTNYPNRIWTKFESDQFKQRTTTGDVIPIVFSDAPVGLFDQIHGVGHLSFDIGVDIETQTDNIVSLLSEKLIDKRRQATPTA